MNANAMSLCHLLRRRAGVAFHPQVWTSPLLATLTTFFCLLPIVALAQSDLTAELPPASPSEETLLFQEIPSVYSASKYEQKVTEAPSSVTIVTADEIKK
jgi:hypothetical protein